MVLRSGQILQVLLHIAFISAARNTHHDKVNTTSNDIDRVVRQIYDPLTRSTHVRHNHNKQQQSLLSLLGGASSSVATAADTADETNPLIINAGGGGGNKFLAIIDQQRPRKKYSYYGGDDEEPAKLLVATTSSSLECCGNGGADDRWLIPDTKLLPIQVPGSLIYSKTGITVSPIFKGRDTVRYTKKYNYAPIYKGTVRYPASLSHHRIISGHQFDPVLLVGHAAKEEDDVKPVTEHIEGDIKYDFRTQTHSL